MPMARSCSSASLLGKWLSIDIRVWSASIGSIVTMPVVLGNSVFTEPSSFANPSRNVIRRRRVDLEDVPEGPRAGRRVGPVMWYSTRPPGFRSCDRHGCGVGRRAPPALELARIGPQLPHALGRRRKLGRQRHVRVSGSLRTAVTVMVASPRCSQQVRHAVDPAAPQLLVPVEQPARRGGAARCRCGRPCGGRPAPSSPGPPARAPRRASARPRSSWGSAWPAPRRPRARRGRGGRCRVGWRPRGRRRPGRRRRSGCIDTTIWLYVASVQVVSEPPDMTSPDNNPSDDARMNVNDWLLDSDPAIRWQVMRDLTHEPAEVVAAERARVATEGWGAQLLALQAPDGRWAGRPWSTRLDGHLPRPRAAPAIRARSRERAGPASHRARAGARHVARPRLREPLGGQAGSSRARSSRASTATPSRPARTSAWT